MLANYTGSYATLRPEWSKGWGYTDTAAWQDSSLPRSQVNDRHNRAGMSVTVFLNVLAIVIAP